MLDRAELERRVYQTIPLSGAESLNHMNSLANIRADIVAALERVQRETADACMEIARECGDAEPLGAYRTFRKIRAAFGIEKGDSGERE